MWRIHVAGDRDIGQLYVFSVYFLSSQENGKGWDSLEQLLGHQGPLTPLPSAAQCVVSCVRSSTTYLAANHITRQPKLGHDVTMVVASLYLEMCKMKFCQSWYESELPKNICKVEH